MDLLDDRVGVLGTVDHVAGADPSLGIKLPQEVVEQLHAELAAGLNGRVDLEALRLADQVADRRGDDHELVGGDHALFVHALEQLLREHRDQGRGQLGPHLLLLVGGEGVDQAVNRSRCGVGVQGAEHQVAGFGRGDGRLDGFQVTHLAHQDAVGVLPQGATQGLGEAGHVGVHLALVDDRFFVLVVVLDRVFDGDDVPVEVDVDVVDHRRERGGLARAGGAGDQKQPTRAADEVLHDRWQADDLDVQQLAGDPPQHHGDAAFLLKDRHAEAGGLFRVVLRAEAEAEVGPAFFLQLVLGAFGADGLHQRRGVFGLKRLGLQLDQTATHAHRRRLAHGEVQVAGFLADDGVEQAVDLNCGHGRGA